MNITDNFTIGFIGLGLIGGSIAKSIRRIFPSYYIIAYDLNQSDLQQALADNTITKISTCIEEDFAKCDYIFLCAPVSYNLEYLSQLKPIIKSTCIITDVGSVKYDIYKAVEDNQLGEHFIGGHPMVGSERSGYDASNDRLIENAYYFVTPSTTVNILYIEDFRTFIEDLGAIPIIYSPQDHDKVTAYISHIPHVIASNLVNIVKNTDDDNGINKQLAAGGFKDITRIASSSPTVWEHILLSNKYNIIDGLNIYIQGIESIIKAIETNDSQTICNFFSEARDYRNSIPDNATGVIRMTYEVFVDIPDEPGQVANILTILARENINLKNIGITHNREDLEGVLRLSFYNNQDTLKSCKLLKENNYIIYER